MTAARLAPDRPSALSGLWTIVPRERVSRPYLQDSRRQ